MSAKRDWRARFSSWVSRNFAPETERQNWGARWTLQQLNRQLGHVTRQLAHAPYMAGNAFTAADISVTYALMLAQRAGGILLADAEQAYVARTTARDAYKRALETVRRRRPGSRVRRVDCR